MSPDADVTYPAQGMTSDVVLVGGHMPCVVKRCRNPRYLTWLAREHHVLGALADSPVPVPRVQGYLEINTLGNAQESWLVMSRLEGRPLWHEMLGANSQRRSHLLQRLGALVRRLHSTPVPVSLTSEVAWIDRMLAEARQNLDWCDGTAELLADLWRRRPAPVQEVLIHGDLALAD